MPIVHQAFLDRRRWAAVRLLAAGLLASLLAGCYQTQVAQQAPYPTDYRERHPITLKEANRSVEIFLGRNRGGLHADQRADVLAFAQMWKHEATGSVVIDVPQGGPNDPAAANAMREIHSIFAASGVPADSVYVRRYQPSRTSLANIRISYSKLTAQAGPCGQWPTDLGPAADSTDFSNRPYWNLGCATQRNLAAMVDNPADLVQPRGEQPAYEARRSVAIDKYRKGENPSGTYTGYETGKISDLGK
jgi:pilus assembly protein CpaD